MNDSSGNQPPLEELPAPPRRSAARSGGDRVCGSGKRQSVVSRFGAVIGVAPPYFCPSAPPRVSRAISLRIIRDLDLRRPPVQGRHSTRHLYRNDREPPALWRESGWQLSRAFGGLAAAFSSIVAASVLGHGSPGIAEDATLVRACITCNLLSVAPGIRCHWGCC
jgi:hypothetical protein